MHKIDRRMFLGLSLGAVAWSCARGGEEAGTASPSPSPDRLALVQVAPEVAVGDRRVAFAMFDGTDPLRVERAADVEFLIGPTDGDPLSLQPRVESIRLGRGGDEAEHAHEAGQVHDILALDVNFESAGVWTAAARMDDRTASAMFEVIERSDTVMVGEQVISVASPTTSDPMGVNPICTRQPACAMHDVTIAEALDAGRPAIITFATPAFCQAQTCGPVVDVVEAAMDEVGEHVAFIHVEVWNSPQAVGQPDGNVEAFRDWRLTTEPWVFFVGADGVIRDRWSGACGADETVRAAQALGAGEL